METGANGANGVLVQRHASKENNQEHVNVIHQLQSTVERVVMENQRKPRYATKKFPVQVSWLCKH